MDRSSLVTLFGILVGCQSPDVSDPPAPDSAEPPPPPQETSTVDAMDPPKPPVLDDAERERLLSLDFEAFDQTPKAGWRALARDEHFEEAAQLLDEYRERHPDLFQGNQYILLFHAGQMYAFAGLTNLALERFENSILEEEPPQSPVRWNAYVEATLAFLRGDRETLLARREEIAAGPEMDGFIPNLNVVDAFVEHFGESYAVAYRAAAPVKPPER